MNFYSKLFEQEVASGWDFFGILYFGLDQKIPKIPKSRGSGSGFENPEKIPSEKSRKSRNPGDRDRGFKIPRKSRENPEKIPRKSRKNPEWEIPKIPKFRGSGFIFSGYPGDIPKWWRPRAQEPHKIQRNTFTSSKRKKAKINFKINFKT